MGCAVGVEHVKTGKTEKIWQIRPEQDALEQGELRDLPSSFDIWSWHHLKGQQGPPNRKLHENHLRSLDAYLNKVKKTPSILQISLMKKMRKQVSHEKVNEVNDAEEVEDVMISIRF